MNDTEIRILSKINELDAAIQTMGKYYSASGNKSTLDFVYRRIEARERLYLYLENN